MRSLDLDILEDAEPPLEQDDMGETLTDDLGGIPSVSTCRQIKIMMGLMITMTIVPKCSTPIRAILT